MSTLRPGGRAPLVALTAEIEQVIGHLVFYSVPDAHVPHALLRAEWIGRGLPAALLPRAPGALSTFQGAARALEQGDLRVDEVLRTPAECVMQVTRVLRDAERRAIEHRRILRLTLARREELIRTERFDADEGAGRLAARVRSLFAARRHCLPGGALRDLIRRQLAALGATAVRASGGVYFCPRAGRDALARMADALAALAPGGEFHRIPLADDAEQRAMVRRHFVANCTAALDGEIRRLRALVGAGGVGEAQLAAGYAERRRLAALKREYAALLADELGELEVRMGVLDAQLGDLAGRAAA